MILLGVIETTRLPIPETCWSWMRSDCSTCYLLTSRHFDLRRYRCQHPSSPIPVLSNHACDLQEPSGTYPTDLSRSPNVHNHPKKQLVKAGLLDTHRKLGDYYYTYRLHVCPPNFTCIWISSNDCIFFFSPWPPHIPWRCMWGLCKCSWSPPLWYVFGICHTYSLDQSGSGPADSRVLQTAMGRRAQFPDLYCLARNLISVPGMSSSEFLHCLPNVKC